MGFWISDLSLSRDGAQSGWLFATAMLPGGTDLKYPAYSADIYPNWEAVFAERDMSVTFKKVHPGKDLQETQMNGGNGGFDRRKFIAGGVGLLAAANTALSQQGAYADSSFAGGPITGPFRPNWESLKAYRCPEWFRDAKFGIWAHWSPQCVPEQGDWYARGMRPANSETELPPLKERVGIGRIAVHWVCCYTQRYSVRTMAFVPGHKHDLFLSYAHQEAAWVEVFSKELCDEFQGLTGQHVTIWQDCQKLRVGQKWTYEIEDGIRNAAAFLAIVSPIYFNSPWCRQERSIVLENELEALKVAPTEFCRVIKKSQSARFGCSE